MRQPRFHVALTGLLLALSLGVARAQAVPGAYSGSPDEAAVRQLLQSSQGADAAYAALARIEGRYAGDADYDYALGTSALDSGRFSHAVFALQRAVAARPGFAGARMDLGRAYYAIGDNESARREFEILQRSDPPPQARAAIAQYLSAIDRRAAAYQRQLSGYAELAAGYDSNANGAPDIQSFLGIPLDNRSQSTSSSYYAFGLGGLVSQPFAPRWRVLGTGSASYRANPDASFVDSQALQLAGAVEWRPGALELSLQPGYATVFLDGEDNHDVASIDAAGSWHFERAVASLNLRGSQTRYAAGLETLDVDTLALGAGLQYLPRAWPGVQLMAALTTGSDDAVEAASPNGRDLSGARLGIAYATGAHRLRLSVTTLAADYDGSFGVPGDREDDQLGAVLGYDWSGLGIRGWTLRAQLAYVDNQSTVPLYDYDRLDAGLSLRKEFR